MLNVIKLPANEYEAVINSVALKKGMNAAIIEKDLWVCITLDYLFHHSKWKSHFVFKGGTCLSKAYHLIERFSEDIDLILDWRILGYKIQEPWEDRTNTKQQKFIKESNEKLFSFLQNEFLPEFKKGMSQMLGINCNMYIEKDDLGTVVFAYPRVYDDSSILNTIRLEIGILASWIPLRETTIKSFIKEEFPNIIASDDIKILSTTPERTFWEKITILHQEAFRPENSLIPLRYSRHYYDIYCMCKKGVDKLALGDISLLDEVTLFKSRFYPRRWARYDLSKIGTIKLLPASHSLSRLNEDYKAMRSMIYGEYPSFEDLLSTIEQLENLINNHR